MPEYPDSINDHQPDLVAVRAMLVEQIRAKPEPVGESPARAEDRWRRDGRLADARCVLRAVHSNARIATALDVTPRTIRYWRAGKHSPNVKHWRQMRALGGLLFDVGRASTTRPVTASP
jgi:hypothetical protein